MTVFGRTFSFSKTELIQLGELLLYAALAGVVNFVLTHLSLFHLTTDEALLAGTALKALKLFLDGKVS